MSIFNKLRQQQFDQTATDTQSYLKLLATIDIENPTDKQTTQLHELAHKAGRTVAEVEADHDAIGAAQAAQRRLAETDGVGATIDDLYHQHQAALAERQAQTHRQNELCRIAHERLTAAQAAVEERRSLADRLGRTPQPILDAVASAENKSKR